MLPCVNCKHIFPLFTWWWPPTFNEILWLNWKIYEFIKKERNRREEENLSEILIKNNITKYTTWDICPFFFLYMLQTHFILYTTFLFPLLILFLSYIISILAWRPFTLQPTSLSKNVHLLCIDFSFYYHFALQYSLRLLLLFLICSILIFMCVLFSKWNGFEYTYVYMIKKGAFLCC